MRSFITLSLSLLAGPTLANDTSPATPPAAHAYDWSGAYAGVTGGYSWMDGIFEVSGYAPKNDSLNGPLFGAFAGVNTQLDNGLVLGLEGDLEYNTKDATVTSDFGAFTGGADWQGSARLRLGYTFDRILLYTTAGWAGTHLSSDFQGIAEATGGFHGYAIGAGADIAVTDRIFGRVDYRYTDFASGDLDFGLATVDTELTQRTLQFGLGLKF